MFRLFLAVLLALPLSASAQDGNVPAPAPEATATKVPDLFLTAEEGGTLTSTGERMTLDEWKSYPAKVKYTPGTPIPDLYTPKRSIKKAPFITGVSMLGGAYFISTAVSAGAADSGNDALLPLIIPVVGPFIAAYGPSGEITASGRWFLLWDGLVQTTGLGLMIWGLVDKQDWLIKKPYGFVSVTPVLGPDYAGAFVQGRF